MQRKEKRKTKGYLIIVLLVLSLFSTYVVLGAVPVNDNMSFTNPDDTNNMYAQLGDYLVITNHTDTDGWEDIDHVLLNFTQGAVLRASFLWTNTTDVFSVVSGDWNLNSTLSSSTRVGTTTNLTWALSPQYDAIEEANVDVDLSVYDSIGGSDTDTYLNQFDVVVNILVMNFTSNHDDDRGNIGQELWFRGDLFFADDPASAVPASFKPADSEYAAISIYNTSNANLGSDTNIVNGTFAVRIYAENSVGLETYNPHIDLVDTNYTDGEEAPTDTFIADRIVVYWEQHNVSVAPVDGWIEGRYRAVLEYDQHPLDQGEPYFLWADNGTEVGLQAAIDAVIVAGGGTVLVPEGVFDFNLIPGSFGFSNRPYAVQIAALNVNISIIGMGAGVTILNQSNYPIYSGAHLLSVGGGVGNGSLRISGITFDGNAIDETNFSTAIGLFGLRDFRVDSCEFIDWNSAGITTSRNYRQGFSHRGRIDHNTFNNPYKFIDIVNFIWGYGITIFGTQGAPPNWVNNTIGDLWGIYQNDTIYIENNTFNLTRHAISSNLGGYYVARFDTFTFPHPFNFGMLDVHEDGGIGIAAYENLLYGWDRGTGTWASVAVWLRGGRSLIFNNSIFDCDYVVGLFKVSVIEKHNLTNTWIWGNTFTNISAPDPGDLIFEGGGSPTLGVDYYLEEIGGYMPEEYPLYMGGIYDYLNSSWRPLVWDDGNSWFEINHTEAAPGTVAISGLTGYEETYGITALVMNITAQDYRYGPAPSINVIPAISTAEVNMVANATIAKINNGDW